MTNLGPEKLQKIFSLLGFASRSNNLAFGKDMLREYISDPRQRKKLVIIATDAGERVKRDLRIRCNLKEVPFLEILSKAELSRATGKQNVAAVGILDEHMVEGILRTLSENG